MGGGEAGVASVGCRAVLNTLRLFEGGLESSVEEAARERSEGLAGVGPPSLFRLVVLALASKGCLGEALLQQLPSG